MLRVQYLVKLNKGCVMITKSLEDAIGNYGIVKRAILNRENKDVSSTVSLVKRVYNTDSEEVTFLLLARTIIFSTNN